MNRLAILNYAPCGTLLGLAPVVQLAEVRVHHSGEAPETVSVVAPPCSDYFSPRGTVASREWALTSTRSSSGWLSR